MSQTATLQTNLSVYGSPEVNLTIPEAYTGSVPSVQSGYAFSTGDNTLTKPTGASKLILYQVTGTLKLYSSSNPSLGTAYHTEIPVTASTIIINASAGATATVIWL